LIELLCPLIILEYCCIQILLELVPVLTVHDDTVLWLTNLLSLLLLITNKRTTISLRVSCDYIFRVHDMILVNGINWSC
jgi:hypothetical protein